MGFWRAVLAGAVGLGCLLAAPAAERPETESYALAWPVLSRQLAAKQYPELVAGVEQYLRQYPLDSYHQRRIVGLVGSVFSLAWTQPEALETAARRILKEFPEVANYYTLAAERLAWNYLLNPQRKPDFAAAEETCRSVLSHLGANLSPALVYAQQLLIWRLHALYGLQRYPEALAAAREAAESAPLVLQNRYFLRHLVYVTRLGGMSEQVLPAAKLYFTLCEFDEKWINESIELCAQALGAAQGPGVALQFAKAQQSAGLPNALAEVPLLAVGEPAVMLRAAGEDPQARLNVLLYQGEVAAAVALAKAQMQRSAGQPALLAQALTNLARCIRAADGAVARANQFLSFHATGEGENPLPALEAELARSK